MSVAPDARGGDGQPLYSQKVIDALKAEIEQLQADKVRLRDLVDQAVELGQKHLARARAAEARAGELERLLKAMTELASENDDDAGKAQDERDTARAEAARLATLLREVLGAPKSPTCHLGLMNRIREQLAAHESAMRKVGEENERLRERISWAIRALHRGGFEWDEIASGLEQALSGQSGVGAV